MKKINAKKFTLKRLSIEPETSSNLQAAMDVTASSPFSVVEFSDPGGAKSAVVSTEFVEIFEALLNGTARLSVHRTSDGCRKSVVVKRDLEGTTANTVVLDVYVDTRKYKMSVPLDWDGVHDFNSQIWIDHPEVAWSLNREGFPGNRTREGMPEDLRIRAGDFLGAFDPWGFADHTVHNTPDFLDALEFLWRFERKRADSSTLMMWCQY